MKGELQELAREREQLRERIARVNDRIAEAAIEARDQGMTVAEIAAALGVSRTALYDFMERRRGE